MKRAHLLLAPGPAPGERRSLLWDLLVPGGIAGTFGGAAIAALAMALTAAFPPHDGWASARWVAGVFFRGSSPAEHPAWAAALGLLVHLGVSGGLGITFAVLLPRGGSGVAALGWGILFGMFTWPVFALLLVPIASPTLHRALDPAVLFALHAAFGACLGVVAPIRRGLERLIALRLELGALASA